MRADLLALTDDALAALANRGIVKRSTREVAGGQGPALAEGDDGTITGMFADGTTAVVPADATLDHATCTCPASDVCRHRVMVVLAYRASRGQNESAAWSPAEFSDADLEAVLGDRAVATARRAFRTGYRARVRRPTPQDPVPTVELPSCTVRFLVPHELGYARVDAARGTRDDAVALAVWAFRTADESGADRETLDVAVGGERLDRAAAGGSGIEPALPLLADLLHDGVAHTGPAVAAAIAQARRALDRRNLRWPVDTLDEVADRLDAYRARRARYHAEDIAALVAEIIARHRCVAGHGASLRPGVLGTEEAAETPLRLLRLTGLGGRVWGDDTTRTVEVYLAHAEAGVVLTLRRRVEVDEDGGEPPSATRLGRRKAGGVRLADLAGGNVVTQSAVRSANRVVRIAESRLARTTVTPSTGAWDGLPAGLLVRDLDAEAARLAGLPPAVVRPRVVAEAVRVVAVDDVADVRYLPGEQRLVAEVRAPVGRATVTLTHAAAAPGGVDALAEAFGGGAAGPVRFVAGHLRRHGGDVVIEPTAVVAGTTVVVPAFAPARGSAVASGRAGTGEPIAAALADAVAVSAEVAHRGWRHLPPGWAGRAERSAQGLRRVGLERAAAALADLAAATRAAPGDGALDRWVDTHLRLLVTAEQL